MRRIYYFLFSVILNIVCTPPFGLRAQLLEITAMTHRQQPMHK